MDYMIETHGLTKRYSETILAVDSLDLHVRRGEVYGFVGPNGAGKTTAMRMLVGLIRPTSGEAQVLGHKPGSTDALEQVGAMIEEPAYYPYLSGRDNLLAMAGHAGVSKQRVDEVLEQVELHDRANDGFDTYSLGMKQRLALAGALLKDPDLLILDEPTNGLDPEGIAEMRDLLRRLGSGNRTVFLSSHLMSEVEQICDRIGVIRRGQLVAEGTLDELRGAPEIRVRAEPLQAALALTRELGFVDQVRNGRDSSIVLATDPCNAPAIARELVEAGMDVLEISPTGASLEEVFLNLVHDQDEERS